MSRLNPPIRPNISGSHSNDLNSIVDAVYAEGSGGGPTISPSISSLVDAVYDEGTREGIRAVDAAFPSNPSDRVAAGLSPTPPQRPTTTSGAAGDFVTSAMLSGIGQVPGMLSGTMRFAQSGMEFQRNPHVGLTVAGGQLADAVRTAWPSVRGAVDATTWCAGGWVESNPVWMPDPDSDRPRYMLVLGLLLGPR